jgi:hypothetical protein
MSLSIQLGEKSCIKVIGIQKLHNIKYLLKLKIFMKKSLTL